MNLILSATVRRVAENRYVQALDLSDLGSQGLISEVGLAVWKRGFMRWVERLKQNELGYLLIEICSYGSDSDILLNRRNIRSKLDILLYNHELQ